MNKPSLRVLEHHLVDTCEKSDSFITVKTAEGSMNAFRDKHNMNKQI
jgi:hypothetical protein